MRWFWIDRFSQFESGRSATAVKNEQYFFCARFNQYRIAKSLAKSRYDTTSTSFAASNSRVAGEVKIQQFLLATFPGFRTARTPHTRAARNRGLKTCGNM